MRRIVFYFLTWKIFIYGFLVLSLTILPLQTAYLGGGLNNYLKNPYLWSFINFDGVHYLSIALEGYRTFTYFYFPVFPLVIKYVSVFLESTGSTNMAITGYVLSNLFLFTALLGFYKLIRLDFSKKIAFLTIAILLVFPTSFYLGSFYNESLFLALVVWCFYFARTNKWMFTAILGVFATATRVVGIALIPALLIEAYLQYKGKNKKVLFPFVSALSTGLGVLLYMLYLNIKTGDPLIFVHSIEVFGQQRSSSLVVLPQVFYRYFFKILPNINYDYFPVVLSTYLEIFSALVFGFLAVFMFYKLRLSYAIYTVFAYLIPTLSGSFSSLPRYVLVLFPAFLLSAIYISKWKTIYKVVFFASQLILLAITASLFFRGFWIS